MQTTVKDFLASVREIYEEMQQLHEEAKGEKISYPDFEAALEHFEKLGLSPGKWAMHVIGPDEIHDMPDEMTALREANKLNKRIVKWRNDDPSPHDPFILALAKNLDVEQA